MTENGLHLQSASVHSRMTPPCILAGEREAIMQASVGICQALTNFQSAALLSSNRAVPLVSLQPDFESLQVQVEPGATVLLLHFLVMKHAVSRLARSSASTLQLHFALDSAKRAQQRPRQVDSGWERPRLVPEQLPFPPSPAENAAVPQEVRDPLQLVYSIVSRGFWYIW